MFLDARLGLEPFDEGFTAEYLRTVMKGRTAPIKAMLLDQRRLAGVGNIYADEALFMARIHPLRAAGKLDRAQAEALREGVIAALQAGIDAKGASIDDFRHIDGVRGTFQDRFLVHLREGEPCVRCGTPVRKLVVGGRGTYVCETCQPRPRRRRVRRQEVVQAAVLLGREQLAEPADELSADDDLREAHHPRALRELETALGVLREVDLLVLDAARGQQALRAGAEGARVGGVDEDLAVGGHFIKYRKVRSLLHERGTRSGRGVTVPAWLSCALATRTRRSAWLPPPRARSAPACVG